jgi:hypothetical protein
MSLETKRTAWPIARPGAAITPRSRPGSDGGAEAHGLDHGGRRGGRRQGRALAHAALDQLDDGGDREVGVRPAGRHADAVAMADGQGHHADRALGAGPAVDGDQGDLRGELAGALGDAGGGAGVDAVLQRHHHLARHLALGDRQGRAGPADRRQLHQEVADRGGMVLLAADDPEGVGIGDHHRGDQALGALRQQVQVEADQPVAGLDRVAVLDVNLEALAAQADGLQPHVHQDLGAVVGPQGDGVARGVHGDHPPVAGRVQGRAQRIDGQAVAQHALGEHRVGRLVQRGDPALERRGQYEIGHRIRFLLLRSTWWSWSGSA